MYKGLSFYKKKQLKTQNQYLNYTITKISISNFNGIYKDLLGIIKIINS